MALTSSLIHCISRWVDTSLVLSLERVVRRVRTQVHLDIRRKDGGEVGERKDSRKGGDLHIAVEVFCKR